MTAHLPPSLLAMFAPRPPIPWMQPTEKRTYPAYHGVAEFVQQFEDPNAPKPEKPPPPTTNSNTITVPFLPFETKKQRKIRIAKERTRQHMEKLDDVFKNWEPHKDTKASSDPYKTLIIARVNFNTSEHKLKREFEMYGPIKKVRIINDKDGKPRGYAFVEFERERDMKVAYKQADGKKIDGRRVVVDYERGRTSRSWRPRRFGGGLGYTRAGTDDSNQKYSGREPPSRREEIALAEIRERDFREGPSSQRIERDHSRGDREREKDGGERERDKEPDREYRGGRERERERPKERKEKSSHRERSRERKDH